MRINKFYKLIIAVAVSELAGVVGSFFTVSAIPNWYAGLVKPALNPPGWVFGPVWVALYFLMGISLWLIWSFEGTRDKTRNKTKALWLFAAQLALNAIWSPVFFGAHSIGGALAIIVLLWAAIVLTIFTFAKVSKMAAWLLVPYILWVSFAVYLNFSIWRLNYSRDSNGVFCTQEAKLCSDGSYVSRTGPDCDFTVCPKENLIRIFTPSVNGEITSPLLVSGEARGKKDNPSGLPEHDDALEMPVTSPKVL
ncbi:MAG: tryptophan-rich sensory protein [Candidatus Yanofskybacteria bacterium]|nr:tryptophan-rich sensory protein [Candidatus Yanofskybacteria bacterium]